MEMKEWIKEQQRRYLDEPRLKELTEVMKQTRVLVRKKEYRKLTELVRRYRKSEDVITKSPACCQPRTCSQHRKKRRKRPGRN